MTTNPILKWWLTPKLPKEHILVSSGAPFKKYLAHYFIHPVRRRLAKYYLALLKRVFGLKVVAITGSAGKTTTKEMVASILSKKGKTEKTIANIDPVYNIPGTILRCTPLTRYLVLEMGVEFKGEMDFYLWLAKPDMAVVTNVYPTHTLYFDDIEGVAKEKGKLPMSLTKKDIAVLNKENKFTSKMGEKTKAKVVWFGETGDIYAEKIKNTSDMNTEFTLVYKKEKKVVQLPILGNQFVQNALAAAGVGYSLDLNSSQIKKGLEEYKVPRNRMRVIKHKSGAVILDDSYNNNPQAAISAIDTLVGVAGDNKKVVVMGDMLELGDLEEKEHKRIGEYIAKNNIHGLIGVGKASKALVDSAKRKSQIKTKWVGKQSEVMEYLKPFLKKDVYILVKGSRSIGLDKVVSKLS